MAEYVLVITPATKSPRGVQMYRGNNNDWVHTQAKAKIFNSTPFVEIDMKYKYNYMKIRD